MNELVHNSYTVAHPSLDDRSRIIVISDVHGNLPYLKGLTDKLSLRPDDQLVLLGDLVEKGPQSLATLRFAMDLARRCRLYPVLGNCDFWHLWVDGSDPAGDESTMRHLLGQKASARSGLILDMCDEIWANLRPESDLFILKTILKLHFKKEFDFLRSMPFALETDKYIFVHGGIPEGETLESAGPWKCMKLDRFYAGRPHFDKWVITGHTPVCLYGGDTISAVPIVDPDCRVACIDGGCVLKDDGQLNALIIQNGEFSFTWYDGFPVAVARTPQRESARHAYIRWGDNQVTPLELGREWCRVRHDRTGYVMDVPTDFLYEKNGQLLVNDVTDYRPAVRPGDRLSVVRRTGRGYWIKKDGITGWYSGKLDFPT